MEAPDQSIDQVEATTSTQASTLGGMLREARERQGMSVSDVANQIKFAPRQIEALEADDFKTMPESAFLRGFVRSYGKLLHLDLEILFAALPETKVAMLSAEPAPNLTAFPNAHTARRQNFIWLGAALLFVIIALGFAIASLNSPAKPDKETPVETAVVLPGDMATVAELPVEPVAPAPEAVAVATADESVAKIGASIPAKQAEVKPVPPQPIKAAKVVEKPASVAKKQVAQDAAKSEVVVPASEKLTIPIDTLLGTHVTKAVSTTEETTQNVSLRIVFGESSWTEVKDKNGKVLSSQVNPVGSELRLDGHAPFTILIGHAQSARLYYKGKQVDLTPFINSTSEVAHVTLE